MPAQSDMIGLGTTLEYNTGSALWDGNTTTPTGTFASIGNITAIEGFEVSADDVDTTHMGVANAARRYRAGLFDSGELTFTVKWFDTDADTLQGLFRTTKAWRIKFVDGSGFGFDGYIKSYTFEAPIDNLITMSCTIKLTNVVIELDAT